MPKKDSKVSVKAWHDHMERNLQVMADSWSNLAEPVAKLAKTLADVHSGDSLKVTSEFLGLVQALQAEIGRCPVIKDGPVPDHCWGGGPGIQVGPKPPKRGPGVR